VVRPTPQRPPSAALKASANATIEALSSRIAALEAALLQQTGASLPENHDTSPNFSGMSISSGPSSSTEGSPDPAEVSQTSCLPHGVKSEEDGPRALIDYNVQVAAVALAQLSLAPKAEYVGNGSVLSALHKASYIPTRIKSLH
jgi:hypothetical protein